MIRKQVGTDGRETKLVEFGADLMTSMARLVDKYPNQFEVITAFVRDWIEVNSRAGGSEGPLNAISSLDLPKLQDAILEARHCRKALDEITQGYARLPNTPDTKLAKTTGHSIGGAVFIGFAIGLVVVLVIVGAAVGGGGGGGGSSGGGGSGGGDSSGGSGGGGGESESEGEGGSKPGGFEGESEGEGGRFGRPGGRPRQPGGGESEGEGRHGRVSKKQKARHA